MFCLSNKSREGQTLFPLYRSTARSMFQTGREISEYANYASHFVSDFASNVGASFAPEDAFHYIYAVLHSPTYRTRYAEFPKIDFPRIPLTTDAELFRKLCALGADLVALHLLEDDYEAASWNVSESGPPAVAGGSSAENKYPPATAGGTDKSPFAQPITRFKGSGNAKVAKGHPKHKDGNVYINPSIL